jgi:hypothetical protein
LTRRNAKTDATPDDRTTVTVDVENVAIGPDALAAALRDDGIDASVVEDTAVLSVLAESGDDVAQRLMAALERVAGEAGAPVVPEQTGPASFALRPPAA